MLLVIVFILFFIRTSVFKNTALAPKSYLNANSVVSLRQTESGDYDLVVLYDNSIISMPFASDHIFDGELACNYDPSSLFITDCQPSADTYSQITTTTSNRRLFLILSLAVASLIFVVLFKILKVKFSCKSFKNINFQEILIE